MLVQCPFPEDRQVPSWENWGFLASGDWELRWVGEAPSHQDPSCSSGPNLHHPQQPGMGNGVKEGEVRLREDAETILPSPVSSKASTWPPLGCSRRSLSCGCAPVPDYPPTHAHTPGWGCVSVRPWWGDTGHPVCNVNPAPQSIGKKSKLHPELAGMSEGVLLRLADTKEPVNSGSVVMAGPHGGFCSQL